MDRINEKLSDYFKSKGVTQEQLAEALGVSQAYVNALLCGKKAFGKKAAQKWNEKYGISASWLLTGEGEMMSRPVSQYNQNGDNVCGENVAVENGRSSKDYLAIIKQQAEQLSKSQEQIDRLLTLIERMQK
jgi:transcriptional regulator with XRE-family HTH domain